MSRCWWKADEPLENLAGGKRVSRWKSDGLLKIRMKLATSKLSQLLDLLKCDKEHA